MGQGYTRNDVSNNIANGNVIDAADLDGEFDAIVDAFAAGTGHTHDGTSAEGGAIEVIGPAQDVIASGTALRPKTDSAYTLGSATHAWSAGFFDQIGVGITNPASYYSLGNDLVVGGAANHGITIRSGGTSQGALYFADGTSGSAAYRGAISYQHSSDHMSFLTAAGERMRIASGGSVGIGTSSPSSFDTNTLVVENSDPSGETCGITISNSSGTGEARLRFAATASFDSKAAVGCNIASNALFFETNGSESMRITSSGNVGIGTNAPSQKLSVSGNISVTGTVDGRDVATDGSKLDGIEAGADVTDTANVTAAGALMDSELTDITAVKSLDQGVSTTDDVTFNGIVVEGSLTSGGDASWSQYHAGADNLILKGNNVGISGIFFQSEEDGTNINHTSDFGFIQFHGHGTEGSGEFNELIIGVSNDDTDHLILNTPTNGGLKYRIGTSDTDYTIWHSGNDGAASGLDADLLDGQHGNYYLPASSYTATDVRFKLTTVDGPGSGIDADLLDGQHGSYYQNASNLNSGTISDSRLPASISSDITGNASTATVLQNSRNIALGGDLSGSANFNGGSNITITATVADNSHNHSASNITSGTLSTARLPSSSETGSGIIERATQAEAEAGTDNARAMTPLRTKQAIAEFAGVPAYESSEQTYVANTTITVSHGLGRVPKNYQVVLRCKTANNGFAVGDEFQITNEVDGDGSRGTQCWVNSTQMKVHRDSLGLQNTSADWTGSVTASHWRVVFYAW